MTNERHDKLRYVSLQVSRLALALTAAAMPGAAMAQDGAEQPAAEEAYTGSEIVVTARRREENLQDVPVAITAFSQRALEQRSIFNPYDLAKAVPGLTTTADSGRGSLPAFSIRGRGVFTGAASGSVETYFADVPLGGPNQVPSLPPQFFDLQSVQVLKGPQGTLFGRNSTGGAVLFVPAAPTDEFEGYARVQAGNFENVQLESALNLPLADWASLRVAGRYWHRKGYTRTIGGRIDGFGRVLPRQYIDNQDVGEVRATLLLEPSDRLTNSTIFTYHTDKNRGSPQAIFLRNRTTDQPIPLTGDEASPRVLDTAVDLRRPAARTFALVNTTTFELSDAVRLKNIFGYVSAAGWGNGPADSDGIAVRAIDPSLPPRRLRNHQYTNELQLQGSLFDDRGNFIVGGLIDLTRQPGDRDEINTYTLNFPTALPGGAGTGFAQQWRQSHFTAKSLFGSLTFKLTDQISFTGGVRHIWDYVRERTADLAVNPPLLAVPANVGLVVHSARFQGWSYNGTIEYRPNDDTMVYGGYRHGYKRGGFNARPPSPDQALFAPEEVDNFHVGLKQDLGGLGIRGHVNIEGFYDLYYGAQRSYLSVATLPGGGTVLATVLANAEKSTYRGFDMDFVAEAAPWIELKGNYTFVDAYYNKFTDRSVTAPAVLASLGNPSTDLSVNPPGQVSKHKLSLSARFHTELADGSEIAFLPTFSYQSKFYLNDQSFRQPNSASILFLNGRNINSASFGANMAPAYDMVDLRLEWNRIGGSSVDVAVNVNNLFDETFITGGAAIYLFGFEAVSFGAPRMATIEAKVRF